MFRLVSIGTSSILSHKIKKGAPTFQTFPELLVNTTNSSTILHVLLSALPIYFNSVVLHYNTMFCFVRHANCPTPTSQSLVIPTR